MFEAVFDIYCLVFSDVMVCACRCPYNRRQHFQIWKHYSGLTKKNNFLLEMGPEGSVWQNTSITRSEISEVEISTQGYHLPIENDLMWPLFASGLTVIRRPAMKTKDLLYMLRGTRIVLRIPKTSESSRTDHGSAPLSRCSTAKLLKNPPVASIPTIAAGRNWKGQPFLNTYHQNLMIQLKRLPASYKNENDASLAR